MIVTVHRLEGSVASPYKPPPETASTPTGKPDLRKLSIWGTLGIFMPPLIPYLFDFLYDPIDREWTVVTFGCSCPDLSGEFRAFNANHFNMILWSMKIVKQFNTGG